MVLAAIITALLVVALALLITFGPVVAILAIPLYVIYRRANPQQPTRTHIKTYRGRIWRIW